MIGSIVMTQNANISISSFFLQFYSQLWEKSQKLLVLTEPNARKQNEKISNKPICKTTHKYCYSEH